MANQQRGYFIFDLDHTLVDTSALDHLRERRRWKECVAGVAQARMYPGLDDFFDKLQSSGRSWAVVTNSVSYYAEAILRHFKLRPHALVCYHDTTYHKPHPAPVLAAVAKMGLAPDASGIGVGDHGSDCSAYAAAGLTPVGAGWSQVFDPSASWSRVAASPAQLAELFGE